MTELRQSLLLAIVQGSLRWDRLAPLPGAACLLASPVLDIALHFVPSISKAIFSHCATFPNNMLVRKDLETLR